MTSALTLARLAALVAIFGFFLPWAEVSCSGQALTHHTGIELITGGEATGAPAHHDLWVTVSFGLIVLGLAGGLLLGRQRAAVVLMAAALGAAVTGLIGVSQEVSSAQVQARAAGAILGAKLEYGYFVTLGGLIAAIAGAGLALAGLRSRSGEPD